MTQKWSHYVILIFLILHCNKSKITAEEKHMSKQVTQLSIEDKKEIAILFSDYFKELTKFFPPKETSIKAFYSKEDTASRPTLDGSVLNIVKSYKIEKVDFVPPSDFGTGDFWKIWITFESIVSIKELHDVNSGKFIRRILNLKPSKNRDRVGMIKENGEWKIHVVELHDDYATPEAALEWAKTLNDEGKLHKQLEKALKK